jgi:hypothetical protein
MGDRLGGPDSDGLLIHSVTLKMVDYFPPQIFRSTIHIVSDGSINSFRDFSKYKLTYTQILTHSIHLYPNDGGSMYLRNIGSIVYIYTM